MPLSRSRAEMLEAAREYFKAACSEGTLDVVIEQLAARDVDDSRRSEIRSKMTHRGGYTAATLKAWGIAWPPRKGWQERLIRDEPEPRDEA